MSAFELAIWLNISSRLYRSFSVSLKDAYHECFSLGDVSFIHTKSSKIRMQTYCLGWTCTIEISTKDWKFGKSVWCCRSKVWSVMRSVGIKPLMHVVIVCVIVSVFFFYFQGMFWFKIKARLFDRQSTGSSNQGHCKEISRNRHQGTLLHYYKLKLFKFKPLEALHLVLRRKFFMHVLFKLIRFS